MKEVRRFPKVGDIIYIYHMFGEPQYKDTTGIVTHIDDMNQIHGTWGGCALIGGDDYVILEPEINES